MTARVRIRLEPLGHTVEIDPGASLQDALFGYGVEFPCGGHGICSGCRVRVIGGQCAATAEDHDAFSDAELAAGWRLACRATAERDLVIGIEQWEAAILADHSVFEFTPRDGYGIAVDLGTTTLVAQCVDLRTGHVLAVETALNPQAVHGADVMSRVQFALTAGGRAELTGLIRSAIGELVLDAAGDVAPREVLIVGNTAMHHLFCGIDVSPLAACPFEPVRDGLETFRSSELGWQLAGNPPVRFLPCLGGFVGSDILAGILATRLHESEALAGLIDLGTNGEIVIGNRERLLCASTAAGPAFEGGRIGIGMRAVTGAIFEVQAVDGEFACRVLGNSAPRGICGSGLVDGIAAALELGMVQPNGRLAGGRRNLPLTAALALTQADVRELQLAKGAIAAGVRMLLDRWGASFSDLRVLYLAGAFGNYVNRASARRIGLLEIPPEKIKPSGNTALLGAKLALFLPENELDYKRLRARIEHVPLGSDPQFQDFFVDSMPFPADV
jgi:uncharacterized 2Fe-2S/4Fe-4S cluster protein (DUF4445 family)